jgi:hypothetical protein
VGLFQLVVPRRFWFSGVLILCRWLATIARLAGFRECAGYEASSVDGWLAQLTLRGPFAIKYRVIGAQHLAKAAGDEAGIFYCSVHLPLAGVMMRALQDLGASPELLLAAPVNINQDGQWLPTGTAVGLNAIPPGPGLLRQVRTLLSGGGRFGSMLDADVGAPIRPTLMRLAGSARARVILCWAVMDATRTIVVTFQTAPHPVPDTEEKVLANLAVLEEQRRRVFTSLRGQHWGRDEETAFAVPSLSQAADNEALY